MTATHSLVIEKEFSHSPAKVWRALTEGSLIREWLLDNDFAPVVGHKFQFRAPPMLPQWDGIIDSEVAVVEPDRKLVYSWVSMGLVSNVTWTLDPTANGTLLRMVQSGFKSDQDAAYKGANYGWQSFLKKMEGVVASL